MIMEVFREFTPTLEPLSIDEAFLDISGSLKLFGGAIAIGEGIRQRITEKTGGLTVSIGIAPNKFLAKLASDLQKPNGMTVVDPDTMQDRLHPLPERTPSSVCLLDRATAHTRRGLTPGPGGAAPRRQGPGGAG